MQCTPDDVPLIERIYLLQTETDPIFLHEQQGRPCNFEAMEEATTREDEVKGHIKRT